jgi:hypothetical protein
MSNREKNYKLNETNWDKHEDNDNILYSYLKKKGKHQRAKDVSKIRSV